MRSRIIAVVPVIMVLGACSESTEPEAPHTTAVALRGTYRLLDSATDAPIVRLVVEDGARYRLRAKGCASDACEEHGTLEVEPEAKELRLTADDGRATRVPFEVLASRDAAPAAGTGVVTSALTPQDNGALVGGSGQLVGQPTQLVKGQSQLVATNVQLLDATYTNDEIPFCSNGATFKATGWTVLGGTDDAYADGKKKALAQCEAASCMTGNAVAGGEERKFNCWVGAGHRCEHGAVATTCSVYASGN